MTKGELPSSAPEPGTRRVPSKKEGRRILDSLFSNPDFVARLGQARKDEDTGNLVTAEDFQAMFPHLPSAAPQPESTPNPWEVLAGQPGFAGPMSRGLEQQRREVPGTPGTGEKWKAYVAAHPEEFSTSIPSGEPKK